MPTCCQTRLLVLLLAIPEPLAKLLHPVARCGAGPPGAYSRKSAVGYFQKSRSR